MVAATTSHRTKRPYQPSIKSFFSSSQTPDNISTNENFSLSHTLPTAVQSSLLNVGMRVRKSVPEGYKTHSKPLSPSTDNLNIANSFHPSHIAYGARPQELMPFCGLHKTGGLDSAPNISDTARTAVDAQGFNANQDPLVPFFSSQESSTSKLSTDSVPASAPATLQNGKRRFDASYISDDEADDDEQDYGDSFFQGSASFPSLATTRGRTIARPRRSRRAMLRRSQRSPPREASSLQHGNDFEEAIFLRPRTECGDDEIEMCDNF